MRQRLVAVILLVTLMPQLTACTVRSTMRVGLAQVPPQELLDARGITTTSGTDVEFDRGGLITVQRDTLFATVRGEPYKVALAQVQQAWVDRPDEAKSTGATFWGVAIAAAAIYGIWWRINHIF
jgi:hypothetical protein